MDSLHLEKWHHLLGSVSWNSVLDGLDIIYRPGNNGNIKILCIFHQERTASLVFHQDGYYKCYGCGHSGTKLRFLLDYLDIELDVRRGDYSRLETFFGGLRAGKIHHPNQLSLF